MDSIEFLQKQQEMPTEELLKIAHEQLSEMCETGAKSFTMRVPADIKDHDMIYSEVLRRLEDCAKK